jgi:hypothetical protein
MIDLIIPAYNFNLFYAQRLMTDVPDAQLAAQPVPGRAMNHAAFILGHLAWASDNGLTLLGQPSMLPADWKDTYGTAVVPVEDRSRYPDKATLLRLLEESHTALSTTLMRAANDIFKQPAPERLQKWFPSLGHMMMGLMTTHEANHLGQLSAWRRAMGWGQVL